MKEPALVADIGGTNVRFALADFTDGAPILRSLRKYRADEFESIGDAASAYLAAVEAMPKASCFAVAGPVTGEKIDFTNSPWVLDIAIVKAALRLEQLLVVNDFEALAAGVRDISKSDLLNVKAGKGDPTAPVLVVGPGTGFGQALIVPCHGRDKIVATEGGHVGFAPKTDEEIELLKLIAGEVDRVSLDHLLSGPGLVNIYRALCAIAGQAPAAMAADEITKTAKDQTNTMAVKTVESFFAILGATVGDAVLAAGARGGVILGGGILPIIREMFSRSQFVERFVDKGPMRDYLENVPVDLIIGEGAALIGAANILRGKVN